MKIALDSTTWLALPCVFVVLSVGIVLLVLLGCGSSNMNRGESVPKSGANSLLHKPGDVATASYTMPDVFTIEFPADFTWGEPQEHELDNGKLVTHFGDNGDSNIRIVVSFQQIEDEPARLREVQDRYETLLKVMSLSGDVVRTTTRPAVEADHSNIYTFSVTTDSTPAGEYRCAFIFGKRNYFLKAFSHDAGEADQLLYFATTFQELSLDAQAKDTEPSDDDQSTSS